jgi:predicted nucleotidyltransferase
MYTNLNNLLRILALFTDGYNRSLHVREIARLLKLSPRTASLALDHLSKKGVLDYEHKGKNKLFSLKINEISEHYLCLAESYKKTIFLDKHFKLNRLSSALKVNGVAVIFGSYAKGIEKKDSDLDIFIAGEYNKKEMEEYQKTTMLDISIKHYPKDAFNNPDFLIKEVIKHHIIIEGQESFVKSLLKMKFAMD